MSLGCLLPLPTWRIPSGEGKIVSFCVKPIFYEAVPPKCNVLLRPHLQDIRVQEKVHQVPTRIRTTNVSGAIANLVQDNSGTLAKYGLLDYYPSTYTATDTESSTDTLTSELLDTETYTGPYLVEAEAPDWLDYVNMEYVSESDKTAMADFVDTTRKHMLLIRQYQHRTLSVTMAL